jgi:UDP:flavonoid glycosyltransferase YjiC (YdhE family)
MIPRLIHQIWHPFAWPEMPPDWQRFAATWQRQHPEFAYRLWGPAESRSFVAEQYPDFLAMYDGYAQPIQRVNALRVLLLHHFGGLCIDLDMECLRNVQPLLDGCRIVLPVEPAQHVHHWRHKGHKQLLAIAFLASEPAHPFWPSVIDEFKGQAGVDDVMESTGPFALTRCYERWDDKTLLNVCAADLLYPVSEPECRDQSAYDVQHWGQATAHAYAVHHWAGSWNRPGQAGKPARRPYPRGLPLKLKHPAFVRERPAPWFQQGPMVSCIMVTRGWSHPARWSIQCFQHQTYANRELVVVTTNAEGDIQPYLESLGDPRIRFAGVLPADTPLGDQRNAAVDHAAGQYVCTWDDDDLFGADRLAAGMAALLATGAAAAFLERICVWWPSRGLLAVTGRRDWENTMIARRDALPRYPGINKSEDTQVVAALLARHPVVSIDDPDLFFYIVTGNNTWGADHFQRIFGGATFQAEGPAYPRMLSAMNKHYPVLPYLAWLQSHDPRTFGVAEAAPAVAAAAAVGHPADHPADHTANNTAAAAGASATRQPALSTEGLRRGRPLAVMMAWELGGGLGHAVALSQVAQPLLAAGHTVHMVLADLSGARAALGPLAAHDRLRLWQAPAWISPLYGSAEPASYPELLFRAGYLDAKRLSGLVQGWSTLLDRLRPDVLVADHAPTALLAARGRRLPRALMGSGFFMPPADAPLASFREWETVPPQRLERSESLVLDTCNALLAARGQPRLDHLHELFQCDETFLATVPELDPFERRARDPASRYWGALAPASHGRPADWPHGAGPAVFAYLKSEYRGLGDVLKALKAGPWRVLACIPGLTPSTVAEVSGPNLRVMVEPIDMAEVCRSCSAALCHAGPGTATTLLHAGKPLVLLPMHAQQHLLARRVQALGAGLHLAEGHAAQAGASLQRVLERPSFAEAARALARRHAGPGSHRVAEAIAKRCVELAGMAPADAQPLTTPSAPLAAHVHATGPD